MATSIGVVRADFVQSVIGPTQTITYHFFTESRTAEVVGYEMVTGSVVIPEQILWADIYYTVKAIGDSAFMNCKNMTSIEMPDLVERIGNHAFDGCSNLTDITFPFNRLKSIGDWAFYECSSLTSIKIPNSVTSIGDYAFLNCRSLGSVRIGNSVTSIGICAFSDTGLTSVTIGNNVISIGSSAFESCTGLTSVTIPNSVTIIGERAFYGCSALTSVAIGYSVTSIGYQTFEWCTSLTSINFIGSIEDWCNKLWNTYLIGHNNKYQLYLNGVLQENIIIPNSVTSIKNGAFDGCASLTSVTIPNSVTSIGDYAFENCSGLTSVEIPNSVTDIGIGAFAFCSGLTSIEIPNSVTSIGICAFEFCSSLTSVTIPNGVTSIGKSAFSDCTGLTSVEIPNSVTSIGEYAFSDCSSLTSITIPISVTSIGKSAFEFCSSLTSVTIGNNITNIGDRAFYYCSGLDSLVFESETPATLGYHAFDNTNNCPLIVPCSAVNAYKTAWPEYADRIACSGTPGNPQETDPSIPTVQDLATAGYDVANKVVLCFYFDDAPCYDVVIAGTYMADEAGSWITDPEQLVHMAALESFEGWYAAEIPYSNNVQGKPIQLKSNGAFSWEYQSGDADAWINKGGAGSQTATIWAGYNNEANIYYYSPGCYIYELAYWKNHNSPCANTTHNYTLHMYAPDACEEMKPAIIGNFNNWNTGVAMKDTTDAQGKKIYTITIASDEGLVFKFRDASYDNWSNELQEYQEGYNVWATFSNFMIPAANQDTTIVYDFSDNDKYRFAQCEKEENVIVWLRVPTGAPGYYNGAIEMVVYSAGGPTAMPLQYNQEDDLWSLELQAKGSNYFSVREANSEDNYILNYTHYYSDSSYEYVWSTWGTTFQSYWENGTGDFAGYKTAMIDLTNPTSYKWARQAIETAIEEVPSDQVQDTKVQKILRNGQILILRGEKVYTLTGQEVK